MDKTTWEFNIPVNIRAGLARVSELVNNGLTIDESIKTLEAELKIDMDSVSHLAKDDFDMFIEKYKY